MFEYATRNKVRFQSVRGWITVEDLWDAPLRSADGFNLDAIARSAKAAKKESTKKSFVDARVEKEGAGVPFDIVKYVIKAKLQEEAALEGAASNRLQRQKLLRVLAEKQDEALSGLSEAELQERIRSLE